MYFSVCITHVHTSIAATGTTTYALMDADNNYTLYGYKWFSSATDADMAFTLARVQDDNGNVKEVSTKHFVLK